MLRSTTGPETTYGAKKFLADRCFQVDLPQCALHRFKLICRQRADVPTGPFRRFLESMMSQDSPRQQAFLAERNWKLGLSACHIGVTAEQLSVPGQAQSEIA
jgi:hypothetical protein